MRYIDLSELLKKRKRWGNRAELWKNATLKQDFRDFSHNKCWYSEVQLLGQDVHIDHFRPKAKIKAFREYRYNAPLKDQGYYWLKNEPSNYRAACTYANRKTGAGGKGEYFPLADGSPLLSPNGEEVEIPLLLDPCVQEDVQFISFSGSKIIAASDEPMVQARVRVTETVYNLLDPYISAERGKIWEHILHVLASYESRNISLDYCIAELKDAVSREAPFSACAIACINSIAPEEIIAGLDLRL